MLLQTYVPTVFENYTACLASEEQRVELSLWDTSGTGGWCMYGGAGGPSGTGVQRGGGSWWGVMAALARGRWFGVLGRCNEGAKPGLWGALGRQWALGGRSGDTWGWVTVGI